MFFLFVFLCFFYPILLFSGQSLKPVVWDKCSLVFVIKSSGTVCEISMLFLWLADTVLEFSCCRCRIFTRLLFGLSECSERRSSSFGLICVLGPEPFPQIYCLKWLVQTTVNKNASNDMQDQILTVFLIFTRACNVRTPDWGGNWRKMRSPTGNHDKIWQSLQWPTWPRLNHKSSEKEWWTRSQTWICGVEVVHFLQKTFERKLVK